jgi:hypothetical protein
VKEEEEEEMKKRGVVEDIENETGRKL